MPVSPAASATSSTTAPAAISIEALRVGRGGRTVVDGLSLDVASGERVTLTGASGVGKSTVLAALLGFIEPAGGRIAIEGVPLDRDSVWQLRARLAHVAQEPELGEGTVEETLRAPFTYRANAALAFERSAACALLERVGLDTRFLGEPVDALSGGEKQRVAVVAALLLERPILLLDEASSALDDTSRRAVIELLEARAGLTILSVSHHPDAFPIGRRTVVLTAPGAREVAGHA
jgi:ABC-type iron transport system FetAB ATPase subunit